MKKALTFLALVSVLYASSPAHSTAPIEVPYADDHTSSLAHVIPSIQVSSRAPETEPVFLPRAVINTIATASDGYTVSNESVNTASVVTSGTSDAFTANSGTAPSTDATLGFDLDAGLGTAERTSNRAPCPNSASYTAPVSTPATSRSSPSTYDARYSTQRPAPATSGSNIRPAAAPCSCRDHSMTPQGKVPHPSHRRSGSAFATSPASAPARAPARARAPTLAPTPVSAPDSIPASIPASASAPVPVRATESPTATPKPIPGTTATTADGSTAATEGENTVSVAADKKSGSSSANGEKGSLAAAAPGIGLGLSTSERVFVDSNGAYHTYVQA